MRTTRALLLLIVIALAVVYAGFLGQSRQFRPSEYWYLLNIEGQPSGYLHVSRHAGTQDAAPVLFVHDIVTRTRDDSHDIHIETHCQDDPYYYPVFATATIGKPGDRPAKLTVSVEKKVPYGASKAKMFITYDTGRKQYHLKKDIPSHTVPAHVLIDIIPLLPYQQGTVFEFNLLDTVKLKPRKNHKIDYLGPEDVEFQGRIMSLHKFRHKGSGVKETFYWTDDKHQVLRCLRDKKEELLLSTQTEIEQLIRD